MDKNNNIMFNIYNETPHFDKKCQEIKEDWIKNCDDLNRNKYNNNIVLKGRETCKNIFKDYYDCHFNSNKNS
jgi:hypothetical protein